MTVRFASTDYSTSISGVGPSYPLARDRPVAVGSFFNDHDMNSYAAVARLASAQHRCRLDKFLAGEFSEVTNLLKKLVGGVVWREPFSTVNSLLTGENTGKS